MRPALLVLLLAFMLNGPGWGAPSPVESGSPAGRPTAYNPPRRTSEPPKTIPDSVFTATASPPPSSYGGGTGRAQPRLTPPPNLNGTSLGSLSWIVLGVLLVPLVAVGYFVLSFLRSVGLRRAAEREQAAGRDGGTPPREHEHP